jgi:hypothetical protein
MSASCLPSGIKAAKIGKAEAKKSGLEKMYNPSTPIFRSS